MRIRDTVLLAANMEHKQVSQARLARHADVSRQFIHMLLTGERRTCSRRVATLIEEALDVIPTTLFLPEESRAIRPAVKRERTAA